MNKRQMTLEFRKAIQLFLATMDVETQAESMLEVASVFPEYEVGKKYCARTDNRPADVFSYGENAVGDAQLYMVLLDHTSAAEWTPDTATSLYKPIGVTEDGYPEWVQPLGATDAYRVGDRVSYNGAIYECISDYNTYAPDVYGWKPVE